MSTSALATLGYLAPSVSGGGAGGPSGVVIFFTLKDVDGNLAGGIDLSAAGVIQISNNNNVAWANRLGAAPTSIGSGLYYYIVDNGELPAGEGHVFLKLVKAGYMSDIFDERVGMTVTTAETAILGAINNALNQTTAAISSSQTAINAHTDADEVAINAHTDAQIAAAQAAIIAAVTAAITTIDGHTDSQLAAAQATIVAAIAAVPANTWSVVLGSHSARQLMVGFFAVLLGKALGLETNAGSFFAFDGVTHRVDYTVNNNGDRVVTLNLGPA